MDCFPWLDVSTFFTQHTRICFVYNFFLSLCFVGHACWDMHYSILIVVIYAHAPPDKVVSCATIIFFLIGSSLTITLILLYSFSCVMHCWLITNDCALLIYEVLIQDKPFYLKMSLNLFAQYSLASFISPCAWDCPSGWEEPSSLVNFKRLEMPDFGIFHEKL